MRIPFFCNMTFKCSRKMCPKLHSKKCHVLTLGKHSNIHTIHTNIDSLRRCSWACISENDLGIIFDSNLSFEEHILAQVRKANSQWLVWSEGASSTCLLRYSGNSTRRLLDFTWNMQMLFGRPNLPNTLSCLKAFKDEQRGWSTRVKVIRTQVVSSRLEFQPLNTGELFLIW